MTIKFGRTGLTPIGEQLMMFLLQPVEQVPGTLIDFMGLRRIWTRGISLQLLVGKSAYLFRRKDLFFVTVSTAVCLSGIGKLSFRKQSS